MALAQLHPIEQTTDLPNLNLKLDNKALQIVDQESLTRATDFSNITAAIGLATVLYDWCPDALWAFLDTESWLSMTWSLSGQSEESKFEIGRIRSQVTFGKLNKDGTWELMVTYDMSEDGGAWVANTEETMIGEENVEDADEIDRLGRSLIRELLLLQPGPKAKYQFFVEAMDAPLDVFGDGLAIDPRWLYKALDLSKCTACTSPAKDGAALSRCGRCGTAAYCSSSCQRQDWTVHKPICTMAMVDRGKALHLSSKGGLVNWDWSNVIDAVEKTENEGDGDDED